MSDFDAKSVGQDPTQERVECPACGGAGGGPFGRAGSAWDDETYVCPRCEGAGMISAVELERLAAAQRTSVKKGLVKATPNEAEVAEKKRKASG